MSAAAAWGSRNGGRPPVVTVVAPEKTATSEGKLFVLRIR